jgi:hypothetical protein
MIRLRPAILLVIGFIAPSAWGAHSVELRHASRELDHAADAFYQTLEHRLGDGPLLADAEYFADGAYEFALRVDSYENPAVLWGDFERLVDRFDYLARAFHADSHASYQSHVADDFYAIEIAMDRLGNAFRAMPRYRQSFNYSYSQWPWYQHRFWVHYHYAPPVRYYLPSIYVHNYYSSGARRGHIARFKRRGYSHRPRHRDRHSPPNRVARTDRQQRGDRNRRNERNRRNAPRSGSTRGNIDANALNNSRRSGDRQARNNDRRRTWTTNNRAAGSPNADQSSRDSRRGGPALAPPRDSNARNANNRRQPRVRNTPRQNRPVTSNNQRSAQTRTTQPPRSVNQNRDRRSRAQRQTNARPSPPASQPRANRNDNPGRSNNSSNRSRGVANTVRAPSEPATRRSGSNNGSRRRMQRR